MSLFADTSFFVALKNKRDINHEPAEIIFADILHGRMGKLTSSDYIFDEAVTMVRRKTKNYEYAVAVGTMIKNSKYINMIKVGNDIIDESFECYKRCEDKDLSITDWTSYNIIKKKGLTGIIAYDSHFEQVGIYTKT